MWQCLEFKVPSCQLLCFCPLSCTVPPSKAQPGSWETGEAGTLEADWGKFPGRRETATGRGHWSEERWDLPLDLAKGKLLGGFGKCGFIGVMGSKACISICMGENERWGSGYSDCGRLTLRRCAVWGNIKMGMRAEGRSTVREVFLFLFLKDGQNSSMLLLEHPERGNFWCNKEEIFARLMFLHRWEGGVDLGFEYGTSFNLWNTCSQTEGAMRIQAQVKGRFGGRWVDEKVFLNAFFFF